MPQEAGINERAVSFTKGCYIGQETVARLHYRASRTATCAGCASGRRPPPAIRCGSASASWARSGPPSSPPPAGPIALAILRREAEPGTTVEVGESAAAEVVELPF